MTTTPILNLENILSEVASNEAKTFYGVSWEDYLEFTKATLDKTNLKVSYQRGILKVMGQGLRHENLSRFLNNLVLMVSLAFQIKVIPAGSMTLISNKARKGADPDESYYVQNAHRITFKKELFDDETDTPPDIVVEIDDSHKSDDKFEIYAAFGIKEFWLYDMKEMRIFELAETGEYLLSENSPALPILSAEVLTDFLNRSQKEDQFKVLNDFQKWLEDNK